MSARKKLRIGTSPLTGTIYAGHLAKDGCTWLSNREDVTTDVLNAIIDKIGVGHILRLEAEGRPSLEIEVREVPPALSPDPGSAPVEGWRPIETAPKDGTRIDIWDGKQRRSNCFWSFNNRWVEPVYTRGSTQRTMSGFPALYWLPAPPPPAEPSRDAQEGK